MTGFLVGVDAGGSHTEVIVADGASLTVRARARGAAGAVAPGRVGAAAQAIALTVRDALHRTGSVDLPAVVVVGAAGVGRDSERTALMVELQEARLARRLEITTDAAIALESVFPQKPGILLNAGSGSITYGRDRAGVVWRVGGLGWQLGDEGGAYELGRRALGAIGRAADGRGSPTALSRAIPESLGVTTLDELVSWANSAAPGQVGALARIVQESAVAGDRVADTLVTDAAQALLEHVVTVLRRFPAGEAVGLALTGGMLSVGTPVRERLEALLTERAPRVELTAQDVDPPRGALAIAVRLRG